MQEGTLRLHDAVFRLERGGPLRSINVVLRLENDMLALNDGKGRFLDAPFEFSGALSKPFTPARTVMLEADGILPLQPLLALRNNFV